MQPRMLLGIGRGVIGHKNVVVTAVQTLAIAAAAGGAGLLSEGSR